jgi:periplasmic divalent cation tolerance protein
VTVTDLRLVLLTAPSERVAAELGRQLVEEQLLACANIVPGLRSIYRWQGKICDEAEVLVLGKTTVDRIEALKGRLPALHPYATPELLTLSIEDGLAPYLDWVRASVGP